MTGGSSKVLVNQMFSQAFKVKRGVRQGCPLAPLLFSLSTQPLMKALRIEELTGHLRGLQLPNLKSVLYELFADDTSVFISASARDFEQARKTIKKFEQASGAKLNVQKSLVLALGNSRNSSWLADLGCQVADNRRRFKFLGVWSGKGITQAEIAEKITASIDGRLRSWVNMYLTFASRLLLIKHVLTTIPSHHLMSVGLDKKGLAMVNRSIRQFLWGTAESGRAKVPLITWDKLHLPKNLGGLGWTSLKLRMESHLAFNAVRLLSSDHQNSNWMRLASAILMKHHSNSLKANWSVPELLLLSNGMRIRFAPTLTKILQAEGELMKRSWFPKEPDKLAMEETWRHIWRKRPKLEAIHRSSIEYPPQNHHANGDCGAFRDISHEKGLDPGHKEKEGGRPAQNMVLKRSESAHQDDNNIETSPQDMRELTVSPSGSDRETELTGETHGSNTEDQHSPPNSRGYFIDVLEDRVYPLSSLDARRLCTLSRRGPRPGRPPD
ncbi:hypothetical protein R1sor_000858 [Riccia sorocarpa]|uniref:Reverse transcriptase domain-containing protein n=1 Tax=Riccia sorocarpa TaxID=122646 RepID=A0ABD3GW13_9MARC